MFQIGYSNKLHYHSHIGNPLVDLSFCSLVNFNSVTLYISKGLRRLIENECYLIPVVDWGNLILLLGVSVHYVCRLVLYCWKADYVR